MVLKLIPNYMEGNLFAKQLLERLSASKTYMT